MIQTKPNRCRHCKERLPADMARHVLHPECIDPWVAIQREKQERARVKAAKVRAAKDKRETRVKLESLKSRAQWAREAQAAVNQYIRLRDAALPCISCGRHHQGQYHAGHFLSVGARPELRFEESNIHKQCAPCNNHLAGNVVLYRKGLLEKIGAEAVDWLEGHHELKRYSTDDLKAIKATYAAKVRELKARTE